MKFLRPGEDIFFLTERRSTNQMWKMGSERPCLPKTFEQGEFYILYKILAISFSKAAGVVEDGKRATGFPSLPTKNFSKFQAILFSEVPFLRKE